MAILLRLNNLQRKPKAILHAKEENGGKPLFDCTVRRIFHGRPRPLARARGERSSPRARLGSEATFGFTVHDMQQEPKAILHNEGRREPRQTPAPKTSC